MQRRVHTEGHYENDDEEDPVDVNQLQDGCVEDPDEIDYENYKGIYFGDEPGKKFQDDRTGAHFDFRDMCKRLDRIHEKRKLYEKLEKQKRLQVEDMEEGLEDTEKVIYKTFSGDRPQQNGGHKNMEDLRMKHQQQDEKNSRVYNKENFSDPNEGLIDALRESLASKKQQFLQLKASRSKSIEKQDIPLKAGYVNQKVNDPFGSSLERKTFDSITGSKTNTISHERRSTTKATADTRQQYMSFNSSNTNNRHDRVASSSGKSSTIQKITKSFLRKNAELAGKSRNSVGGVNGTMATRVQETSSVNIDRQSSQNRSHSSSKMQMIADELRKSLTKSPGMKMANTNKSISKASEDRSRLLSSGKKTSEKTKELMKSFTKMSSGGGIPFSNTQNLYTELYKSNIRAQISKEIIQALETKKSNLSRNGIEKVGSLRTKSGTQVIDSKQRNTYIAGAVNGRNNDIRSMKSSSNDKQSSSYINGKYNLSIHK